MNISGGGSLEGESFTVKGTTFTFTANPLLATDIDLIDGFNFATNEVLTQRAADAITLSLVRTYPASTSPLSIPMRRRV